MVPRNSNYHILATTHINAYLYNTFKIKANNPGRVSTRASCPQAEAALEGLVTFTENFQGRGEWEGCAKWCDRAIRLAKELSNSPAPPFKPAEPPETVREDSLAKTAKSMLASLFTLRGGYQCGATTVLKSHASTVRHMGYVWGVSS